MISLNNSSSQDKIFTPSDVDSNPPSPIEEKQPNCWKSFTKSKCFKYTKIVFIVIYGLNVVAWGGMLFLILVGAANNTMPDEHTRKVWIEIDSQILNALFCVTGIGLIPWRVRDVIQFHWVKYRPKVLRRHKYTTNTTWIAVVIWTFIANSLFQIGMAVTMWSMNMYNRPPWLVGIFVGLGCVSGIVAGLIQFFLGRQTKKKNKIEQEKADIVTA